MTEKRSKIEKKKKKKKETVLEALEFAYFVSIPFVFLWH